MIRRAVEKKGTYFYLLPTYKQAKKVIWDNIDNDGFKMLDHIPKELLKSMNSTELKIELVNGSIIQLIAADEFKESAVGTNPVGVVFSEYSISSPEAWKYLSPILAVNGGWVIFNFTPRGMNHAYKLLQDAKGSDRWFWEILTVDDTKVISPEDLEEEKRTNPKDTIDQEYYCKFLDGGSQVFKRIEENLWDGVLYPQAGRSYQLGVDLAKYHDFTVITPVDLHTFRVGLQDSFNHIDWNVQKAKIEAASMRFNGARTNLDSTGVGDPIFEDLARQGIPVNSFKFTEQSKKDLLNNLAILLEQDKIKLPRDEDLINQLRGIQWELSENGKLKIVSVTDHDDKVMSLALAVWGLTNPIPLPTGQDEGMYLAQSFS